MGRLCWLAVALHTDACDATPFTSTQSSRKTQNNACASWSSSCPQDVVRTITQPLKPDEITLLHHLLDL